MAKIQRLNLVFLNCPLKSSSSNFISCSKFCCWSVDQNVFLSFFSKSNNQALSLWSFQSIGFFGSRYIPTIFGSHTTHLKIKAPKPYAIKDTAVFHLSGKCLRFYINFSLISYVYLQTVLYTYWKKYLFTKQ